MTRPAWSAPLGVLTRVLRWLGLSVLAGLITAAGAATLLTLTWLMVEGAGALTNVPYAWLGVFALLVAVGLSSGALARLPRAGAWMLWVKRAFAAIMLGVAEYYLVKMGQVYF